MASFKIRLFRSYSCLALIGLFCAGCTINGGGNPDADIYPLVSRDLSLTTSSSHYTNLARADSDAIQPSQSAKVITWLLRSSRHSFYDLPGTGDAQYCPDGILKSGAKLEAFIGEAAWLTRALRAYIPLRATASPADRAIIDQWFLRNADFEVEHMNSFLVKIFPGRLTGDYSQKIGAAATHDVVTGRYITQNGVAISVLSQWYNNRRSVDHGFLALAGSFFYADYPLKAAAYVKVVKQYVKEWVTYSVFPTGEQGEWNRNHSYPNADGDYIEAQGLPYGAYNCQLALNAALWFHRVLGDNELLNFSTRDGLWGSECGPSDQAKTIWTASDLHIDLLVGDQSRINDFGKTIDINAANYDYPNAGEFKRNRALHASWYLPAYRQLRPNHPYTQKIETWLTGTVNYLNTKPHLRADDSYGLWRNFAGISIDTRSEDYAWLYP